MARKRISRDDMFTQIVQVVAQRSTCLRSQVGALIVKDGRIISMGYNGPVSGIPECKEIPSFEELVTDPNYNDRPVSQVIHELEEDPLLCEGPGCTRSLHAETNAIAFAARAGVSVEGCTLYCSMSPCINCAKVIVNSGIKEVKFLEKYRNEDGIKLLERAGIAVVDLGGTEDGN
jgi:dCMP deaminase